MNKKEIKIGDVVLHENKLALISKVYTNTNEVEISYLEVNRIRDNIKLSKCIVAVEDIQFDDEEEFLQSSINPIGLLYKVQLCLKNGYEYSHLVETV